MQTKAHGDGGIDLMHHRTIHTTHVLPQPLFIQGTDLLQQDHRVLGQTVLPGSQFNVGGQSGFPRLGGDGRRNDRGAVPVSGVVLNDQNRSHATLLTANHWAQVCVKDVSPLY